MFSKNKYGKGNVYFLAYPIELNCLKEADEELEYTFYKVLNKNPNKAVVCDNPMIGITEHFINENQKLIIAINYGNEEFDFSFTLIDTYKILKIIYGDIKKINKHDVVVFEINKES